MLRDYFHHTTRFPLAARLFLAGEFLAGIGLGTLWVLRNLYLSRLGYEEGFIGQIIAVSGLGLAVVALPLSLFMDRNRLKGYLLAGALALGAGIVGTALWPHKVPLLIFGFIGGSGTALLTVGSVPFYMRVSTPAERPFLFGVGTALGPASGLVGTLLVWVLSHVWGEDATGMARMMILSGGIAGAGAFLFALIDEARVEAPAAGPLELDRRAAFRLCLPISIIGLGAGLTIPFINLYFEKRFLFGPGRISLIFSLAQILTMFAFLASPLLARRFGGVRTVVACQLLSIPFFLVMAFTGQAALAVAAVLGRHALMNMAGPVTAQFSMEAVSPHKRALTNGLRESTWNGMFMFGNLVGGWVTHAKPFRDGFTETMLATIALYLIGSVLFYAFWRTSSVLKPRAAGVPEPIEA